MQAYLDALAKIKNAETIADIETEQAAMSSIIEKFKQS